jgi:hypothetical protein
MPSHDHEQPNQQTALTGPQRYAGPPTKGFLAAGFRWSPTPCVTWQTLKPSNELVLIDGEAMPAPRAGWWTPQFSTSTPDDHNNADLVPKSFHEYTPEEFQRWSQ